MRYRADIDGLRAIAVLAVLVFHYGSDAVPGGFIGVDVFFVISGYLITGVLINDGLGERLPLLEFYDRRIRRIFPAMLVVVIASFVAGYWFLSPGDYLELGRSGFYSAVSLANVYFLQHTGYFDQRSNLLPLLHMWSLAVEEQFYLIWPVLLAGILAVARSSQRIVIGLIAGVIVLSFAASSYEVMTAPKAAFFLPHGRAWELAIGAAIVFLPPLRLHQWQVEILRAVGLALIAYGAFALTDLSPFPGPNALFPCLGAALLIWPSERHALVSGVLGTLPFRFVGQISYSLYLWHWPVLVFFRHYANGATPTIAEAGSLGIASILVATLSWRYVEQPFRRRRLRPKVTVLYGATSAAIVAIIGILIATHDGFPQRISPEVYAMRSREAMWTWKCPQFRSFEGLPGLPATLMPPEGKIGDYCVFGAPWETAAVRGILWGDSHAEDLSPILENLARTHNASIMLYRDCAVIIHAPEVNIASPGSPTLAEDCAAGRERGLRFISSHPDIRLVVFAAAWAGYLPSIYGDDQSQQSVTNGLSLMHRDLDALVPAILSPGRTIAFVGDFPQWTFDPIPCAIRGFTSLIRRPCPMIKGRFAQTSLGRGNILGMKFSGRLAKNGQQPLLSFPATKCVMKADA
jgi:peptidoglycan/LPS O-acetylase OafA/YrhL